MAVHRKSRCDSRSNLSCVVGVACSGRAGSPLHELPDRRHGIINLAAAGTRRAGANSNPAYVVHFRNEGQQAREEELQEETRDTFKS